MTNSTSNPDIQKLQTLLAVVEEEFHDGLKGRGLVINKNSRLPHSEMTEDAIAAFNAFQESGGCITQNNVHQIAPILFYAEKATVVQIIPDYLRALLALTSRHPDDLASANKTMESMYILARPFGETLHGVNRDEIEHGKPSVSIRLKNAEIYKTYMTRGMRKALKAYLVAWFDYFTANYASKLGQRRQWFHNSWL